MRRVLRAVGIGVALAAFACAPSAATTLQPPPFTPVPVRESDPLDRFLLQRVLGGRVDYAGIRAHDRARLDSLIAGLAATDTAGWSAPRRAALHVDLYNLVMIRAVLDRWRPGWTPAADGFAVFKAPLVPARGGAISLDELEKRRTPAVLRDPRLHAAFNCAAVSCPPLADRGWSSHPERLEQRLEGALSSFVHHGSGARVDEARRMLRLSRIFDWYADDFGGRAGVLRTLSRYLGREVIRYRVEFLDYDWSLNAATFPDGSTPR
jgi:hypothetical protein